MDGRVLGESRVQLVQRIMNRRILVVVTPARPNNGRRNRGSRAGGGSSRSVPRAVPNARQPMRCSAKLK
jgi:hypothetical protein